MDKFYNFNVNNDVTELYVYGVICSGSDKWDESDVVFNDFKSILDGIGYNSTLNIMVNSCGGDVFTTEGIIAMLKRAKAIKDIKINCYIDGIGASCASWLPMVADNIYIYSGSILMLHKPMTTMWGANANDMKKEIEILDKIENAMIECYMKKAKEGVTEDDFREMLSNETWLDATEIQNYFNVTLLEDSKQIVACIDDDIFKRYNKVPQLIYDNNKKIEEQAIKEAEEKAKAELENKNKLLDLELALL